MQLARHSLNALLLALALGTTPAMAEDAEPLAVAASLRVVGASIDNTHFVRNGRAPAARFSGERQRPRGVVWHS